MKQHIRIVVLLASGFLATTAAAQPKLDTCSGVLIDFNGELALRAGREVSAPFRQTTARRLPRFARRDISVRSPAWSISVETQANASRYRALSRSATLPRPND